MPQSNESVTSLSRDRGKLANLASDIDKHVGARIRERRITMGLGQQQMADMIGVAYQKAHKYECGQIVSRQASCMRSNDF